MIAVIGDLHFGIRLGDDRYLKFQIDEWKAFVANLKKQKVTRMIFLGDFFNDRNFISVKILNMILKEVLDNNIKLIMLIGNHDALFKNTNRINTPDLVFGKNKNIRIISEPEEITIDDVPCLFMPWINKENQETALQSIKDAKAKFCFGHFELTGFEMTNGIVCRAGMQPKLLKKFDRVITGHFHLKQQLGNISYIGSFYQQTWADYDDQKEYWLMDLKKNTFADYTSSRQIFRKFHFDKDNPITEAHIKHSQECFVKVYLDYKLKKKEEMILSKMMESAITCDVINNTILLENSMDGDEISMSEDFLETFEGYMELQEDLDKQLKAGVMKLIKSTYAEALKEQADGN
jgi:DNA repair exonuclease SbcCD nuclease subunit